MVFATRNRAMVLEKEHRKELYMYLYGVLKARNCFTLRIGGIENHVHLLFDLHPAVALADVVKSLKQGSSGWARKQDFFPYFAGWASGYFAGSVGPEGKDRCIEYIKGQEVHHHGVEYIDEIKQEIEQHGLLWVDSEW